MRTPTKHAPQGGREFGHLPTLAIHSACGKPSRMTKVIEAIDYLAQLGQRYRHHYTDEGWGTMYKALWTKNLTRQVGLRISANG